MQLQRRTEVFGPRTVSGSFFARHISVHRLIGWDDEWNTILLETTARKVLPNDQRNLLLDAYITTDPTKRG